jgi:hypothetical protein
MLPIYRLILLVALIALVVRHVREPKASVRSKQAVGALAAISVLAGFLRPLSLLVVAPIQAGICAYIILHRLIASVDAEPTAIPPADRDETTPVAKTLP